MSTKVCPSFLCMDRSYNLEVPKPLKYSREMETTSAVNFERFSCKNSPHYFLHPLHLRLS